MSENPEQIRQDIEVTRGRLSDDVDVLTETVRPSNVARGPSSTDVPSTETASRRARAAGMDGVAHCAGALADPPSLRNGRSPDSTTEGASCASGAAKPDGDVGSAASPARNS